MRAGKYVSDNVLSQRLKTRDIYDNIICYFPLP